MYIRQECMFSFEEILKFQKENRLQLILSQLDFSNLINKLNKPSHKRGPKGHNPVSLINALIAMQVEKINDFKRLKERLDSDLSLKYNCGFDILKPAPSTSTFSRFLTKISSMPELEDEFKRLILKAKDLGIIDGTNVAIDATKLDSFEKAKPKSKISDDGVSPNWGKKKDTDGNDIKWFGWKAHIIVDCKSELPLYIDITPASFNDGKYAIPLLKKFKQFWGSILNPKYYIMDSGYDIEENYNYIINNTNGQAIIAYNKRGSYAPPEGFNDNLWPVCSMGYPLSFWGIDGNYIKLRCPHATGKVDCPYGLNWCSSSNYGYCLKVNYKKNHRLFSYPLRGSEKWVKLYNLRTSVERCNSRLKEYLNLDNIRSAGIAKAKTWALLNCIALVAGTIAVNKLNTLSTSA